MDNYYLKRNDAIDLKNLMYLEAEINYTFFYFSDGTKVLSSLTLKRHQENLNDTQFVRVSRSYLVNKDYIQEIRIKNDTSFLAMKNGLEFRVSRRRRENLSLFA